jgi:hypothetical protein
MLIRRVIENKVHNQSNPTLTCFRLQPIEVGHGPKLRVDTTKIRNVIAEINLRRGIEGCYPDRIDSEIVQVIEVLCDSVEVSDSVAIRITEAAGIDLVNDRVTPPVLIRRRPVCWCVNESAKTQQES